MVRVATVSPETDLIWTYYTWICCPSADCFDGVCSRYIGGIGPRSMMKKKNLLFSHESTFTEVSALAPDLRYLALTRLQIFFSYSCFRIDLRQTDLCYRGGGLRTILAAAPVSYISAAHSKLPFSPPSHIAPTASPF